MEYQSLVQVEIQLRDPLTFNMVPYSLFLHSSFTVQHLFYFLLENLRDPKIFKDSPRIFTALENKYLSYDTQRETTRKESSDAMEDITDDTLRNILEESNRMVLYEMWNGKIFKGFGHKDLVQTLPDNIIIVAEVLLQVY